MSVDKQRLKALAEAQPVQIWKRTRARRPDMKGQPLMYGVDGPEGVSDWEDWGFTGKAAEYIAAASPTTVLALLAEIERLATTRSRKERDLEQELEVWRHGPSCWSCGDTGDVHDITGEWRGECDCLAAQLINANRERDQLKAENEALRKDAERYRWLRDSSESIHQFYLSTPIWFTGVKFTKENVDSTIDAALAKAVSND